MREVTWQDSTRSIKVLILRERERELAILPTRLISLLRLLV